MSNQKISRRMKKRGVVVSRSHHRTRNSSVRRSSAQYLALMGVTVEAVNSGEYLLVDAGDSGKIRYHPTSGTWKAPLGPRVRGGVKAFARYVVSKLNKS